MVGTSGIGKTETALALADLLYGGEQNLTVINMTEFKEEHKVSLLMGSPPGYVGYGEGGVLTEAVRRRPYSVLLLDEMEKAHPGVQDVFFQVFDKGCDEGWRGPRHRLQEHCHHHDIECRHRADRQAVRRSRNGTGRGGARRGVAAGTGEAFQARLSRPGHGSCRICRFPTRSSDGSCSCSSTASRRRVWDSYRAELTCAPAVAETIAARCKESSAGARNIESILSRTLLPELSAEVLARIAAAAPIARVAVQAGADGAFRYVLS